MKKIALIILMLISSICNAKYEPQILSKMIDNSTLVGRGKIIKIHGSQILFRLDEVYKGKSKSKVLKVNQFEDWTCARRWTSYKVGQEELLFLKDTSFESYDILGSGNEGEMPIFSNTLYYKSPDNNFDDNATEYKFNGDSLWGYKMSLSDLKYGIISYVLHRETFHSIAKNKTSKPEKIKNSFLRMLVTELKDRIYAYQ